jgi:hypothetical protein
MNITRTLIGTCAVPDSENDSVKVDMTGFIRRLLLFHKFIFESIRLKEIPFLLNVFGYDGLMSLLKSNALTIHCDAFTLSQTGQLKVLESRVKKGLLPLCSYAPSTIRITDWDSYIDDCLRVLDLIQSLTSAKRNTLKNVLRSSLVRYPSDFGTITLTQLKIDLATNKPMIKTLVTRTLGERLGSSITKGDFDIKVHQIDETDFKVESDIASQFHLSQLETHHIIENALFAAGGLNKRIEEMQVYSAISGFLPEDVDMFREKLGFLLQSLLPEHQEKRFQRILTIKGIPELDRIDMDTRIDAEKFLKIRDSLECREFRTWLSSLGSVSDSEIRERVSGLQARLSVLHAKPGKDLRFIVITGIGAIPGVGNIVGTALGALDYFLVEKMIPYSGPATFINEMYPSLFERTKSP